MNKQLLQGVGLGMAAAVVALLLWLGGALQPLETLTWQWRVAAAVEPPRTPIVLVALDQQSLDWGRRENGLSWPWPREAYGLLLDFCRRGGARGVALDLLFSEPSAYGVADDQALAETLATLPTVGGIALRRQKESEGWPASVPPAPWRVTGNLALLPAYNGGAFPVAELGRGFTALGNVSAQPDADGVYRRLSVLDRLDQIPVPSLGLALLLASEPELRLTVGSQQLTVGNHVVPLDGNGQAILRFRGPSGTFTTLSAAALIQSELRLRAGEAPTIDPETLRGRYVFFGLTAPGLYDLRTTPLDGVFPGMEIHATLLDNLLSDDFLSAAPLFWTLLSTFLLAVATGLLVRRANRVWQTLLIVLCGAPLPLLLGYGAYHCGWWLPMAPASCAFAGAFASTLLLNYATEGKKRRFIKRAFNQYLHPTVIEQLLEHPERLRLGGERRELSIFFSDLQGFTGLSEQLDPEALTALLNDYLTAMTDLILDSGGTIDKYEGDAIIAFWNAPLDQPDHALRAVTTALACQARLTELRPHFRQRTGHDLFMRIGINTGLAVVGNMGSQRRFDYTMLGDAVNLAARLEGVNKEFGTYTLLAEATCRQLAGQLSLREIGRVGVVGRKEPVRIYEPLAVETTTAANHGRFAAALALFYTGNFTDAADAFSSFSAEDPVAGRYAERCRQLAAAPPSEWDGVWRLNSK